MNKITTFILFFLLLGATVSAQVPYGVNYQAVIRDAQLQIVAEKNVSVRFSILKGGIEGQTVYMETHTALTNKYGVLNLILGHGTSEGNFSAIQWYDDSYFVKVEVDTEGGSNYTEVSTQQMMSVPYALYAARSGEVVRKADFRLIFDEVPNPLNGETMSDEDSWGWVQVFFLNEEKQDINVQLEGCPAGMTYTVEYGGKSVYGTSFKIRMSCSESVQSKNYPLVLKVSNNAGITKEYTFEYKVETSKDPGTSEETTWQSESDTRSFLNMVYANRQQWMQKLKAIDNSYVKQNDELPEFYNHTFTASNRQLEMIWAEMYAYITHTNMLIMVSMPQTEWANTAKGEARALRAEAYMKLVETFGDVPVSLDIQNEELNLSRVNKEEVLNFVIEDLAQAGVYLPVENGNGYFSKNDAFFVMSQAYLLLGRWENAMRQIENSTPVLSPYSSIDSFLVNAGALYKTGRMEEAKRIFMEIGCNISVDTVLTDDSVAQIYLDKLHGEGKGRFILQVLGNTASYLKISGFRSLLPIPESEISKNPNLTQNPGY